jgi:putative hydrolase
MDPRIKASGDAVVDNAAVASVLREVADLLSKQGANHFRILAYRRAADTLEQLSTNAADIVACQGADGLLELPHIGRGLAATIEEIVGRGRCTLLDRLRGETDPEALLQTVPGIGPRLAHVIHEQLHVDTLEALEVAANDGRLQSLPHLGPRRVAAIRASIASMLSRRRPSAAALREPDRTGPTAALLLDMDRKYRLGSQADELPKIAPRRFNPDREAWLPVMHSDREGWHCTVLYSNTARAHELGRTHDWVVIYGYEGEHRESQHTVVTETHGPLVGRRVVRGREAECRAYYDREAMAGAQGKTCEWDQAAFSTSRSLRRSKGTLAS